MYFLSVKTLPDVYHSGIDDTIANTYMVIVKNTAVLGKNHYLFNVIIMSLIIVCISFDTNSSLAHS